MKNYLLLLPLLLLFSVPASAQCVVTDGAVSLRQCGAAGDDNADDSPALQAALDALADARGGVLNVEGGVYRIATPVSRSFLNTEASSVIVRGLGSASVLHIATGSATTAVSLSQAENLSFEDLTFVGTPGTNTDARVALFVGSAKVAFFKNVSFYGVSSAEPGGAVLRVTGSGLSTQNLYFRGCTGAYAAGVPVLHVDSWIGVNMRDTEFIDYGTLAGVYHSKTGIPAYAWILAGSPRQPNEPVFMIERAYLDEGAGYGVFVNSPTIRPHIRIVGVNENVNGTEIGGGIAVSGAKSLKVSQSWFGFASGGSVRNAVSASGVESAVLEHVEAVADARRIFADASVGVLTLSGCDVGELVSSAKSNRVIESKVGAYQFSASAVVTIEKNGQVTSSERSLVPDFRTAFQGGGVAITGLAQAQNVRFSNNSRNYPGNGRSYTYYIVAVDAYGRRGLPRAAVHTDGWSALTNYQGGCCWIQVSWDPVPGAVSYDVMRGSTTQKIGSVTTPLILDRGGPPTAYTPPTTDETATLKVEGRVTTPELVLSGIPIMAGTGAPTGACTLGLYLRKDTGAAVPALYVCENGAWVAK